MNVAAIILAAGQGKRMKSSLAKPLHQIGGRPMLAWSLDAAKSAGATRIITVLSKDSGEIQSWLGEEEFAIQDPPLGTGHAVMCTRDKLAGFDGIALVVFADTPLVSGQTLNRLTNQVAGGHDIALLAFETGRPDGYGRIVRDPHGQVERIVEDRDATATEKEITLVNGGIMACRAPLIFDLLDKVNAGNAQREIYLTDIVAIARVQGFTIGYEITTSAELLGVNSRADLALVEASMQQQLRQAAMDEGVTLIAPETVFLNANSVIERDVIIEPHVVIGSGCHIGEGSIIKAFSHLEGAVLGPCCVIGPYARLRPGTNASEGVKIGNFVETKNTVLGTGAKANHLTYLGDAEIGAGANIGAGTITCNYDGFNKFKTIIGENAFIGSNTALVAPVSIGDGAVIGAGSTVTENIEQDDIALTRAPMERRSGAAKDFRDRKKATRAKKNSKPDG